MGTTAQKLTYLNDTKQLLKDSINSLGGEITSQTTFRQYATELDSIYANLPKVSGSGSNINLSPTKIGRITSQINGDTFQQTYTGKNLFNKNGQLTLGARLASNGTAYTSGASDYYISEWIKIDGNTTYTKNSPTADAFHRVCFYTSNSASDFISYSETNTFTTPATAVYLRFCGLKTELDTTQLEQGSTATSFEPFVGGTASPNPQFPQSIQSVTGTQNITISDGTNTDTYTIHLGNIELNKIGDYKDYITGTPDNWSIIKNIGKYVLDSTKNWYTSGTKDYQVTLGGVNRIYLKQSATGYSNYFRVSNSGNDIFMWPILQGSTDYIRIVNAINKWETVDDFKTWLSSNNVELVYPLATPTTTPITDTTLINDLNNFYYAMSKNGETNISVDGNLPIILDVSALKEVE